MMTVKIFDTFYLIQPTPHLDIAGAQGDKRWQRSVRQGQKEAFQIAQLPLRQRQCS